MEPECRGIFKSYSLIDLFELSWMIDKLQRKDKFQPLPIEKPIKAMLTVFSGHTVFSLFQDSEDDLGIILHQM